MNQQEIINKVNSVMQEGFELAPEKLVPTARLFQDLGLDSLDAVDMLVNLEDSLSIKVDVDRFKNVRTLQDVYELAHALENESKTKGEV